MDQLPSSFTPKEVEAGVQFIRPVLLPKQWQHLAVVRANLEGSRMQSILGMEGSVVICVDDNLRNRSHTTPQADQQADEADELQKAPLGGKLLQTCTTMSVS